MITIEQAKSLRYGTTLHHNEVKQGGGKECFRVRVSGACKTWKRDSNRVELPVKHGMYGPSYRLNADEFTFDGVMETLANWHLESECHC